MFWSSQAEYPSPTPRYAETLVPAPGVAAIGNLEAFLPECAKLIRRPRPTSGVDSVAGWGFKPTARYARNLAAQRGWPYLAIEDGFLRSVGLGESGAPSMSMLVDDLGVYYDAHRPSRLEVLLESRDWDDRQLLARARSCIERIVETGLSKTNVAPPLAAGVLPNISRRRILVVDQTDADASIAGGLADNQTFYRMLEAARRDEGDAQIVIRRHPAVAAGLKRGCLPDNVGDDLLVLAEDFRVADVLAQVDAVYTVTSLTGFEALIRGLPVRCFGLPFYAGWGLTRDEMVCERRTRRPSIEALFAVCYLLYPRYVDPLTGQPASPEAAIERLVSFRDRADRQAGYTACLGFAPWKHGSARTQLYSPRGEVQFFSRPRAAISAAREHGGRVIFWAGRETASLVSELERGGAPWLRMEDGFVRSRGLGSDFHRAASVVLDDLGIYYDATRPSRLEVIYQEAQFDHATLERAKRLRGQLVAAGLSKYNLWSDRPSPDWPSEQFKLLVVGQVEDDKSLLKGCESVRTNLDLLKAARTAHPSAFVIYKPHPDVEAGNRVGAVPPAALADFADAVAANVDIIACLEFADAVATMTSLAGFEALLREKPVWAFGRPFYAGWGLTQDALDFPRRTRKLTLDQLVAGALIRYPIYVYPQNGLPCGPEEVVSFLEASRSARPESGQKRIRYLRAALESLRPNPLASY